MLYSLIPSIMSVFQIPASFPARAVRKNGVHLSFTFAPALNAFLFSLGFFATSWPVHRSIKQGPGWGSIATG